MPFLPPSDLARLLLALLLDEPLSPADRYALALELLQLHRALGAALAGTSPGDGS